MHRKEGKTIEWAVREKEGEERNGTTFFPPKGTKENLGAPTRGKTKAEEPRTRNAHQKAGKDARPEIDLHQTRLAGRQPENRAFESNPPR